MKKKLLSIALICAMVLSCFTAVVFATDGTDESTEVLGGVIALAKGHTLTAKVSGNETNKSVNTPFKNIEFGDEKTTRSFTFAVYNDTEATVKIMPSFGWAMVCSDNLELNEKNEIKTPINNESVEVEAGKYQTVTLEIKSGLYWNNSNKIDTNGSNGARVDGSGVGFRIESSVGGNLYMVCIGGDNDITENEIKQINKNLSELENGDKKSIAAAITDCEQDDHARVLGAIKNTGLGGVWTITNGTHVMTKPTRQSEKNTTVNTLFKNIDFGTEQTTRTFKFAVYNETEESVDISLSFIYGTYTATKVEKNEDGTYKVYNEQTNKEGGYVETVKTGEYKTIELKVPSGYWWLNHDGRPSLNDDNTRTASAADAADHGSGCYMDGSSVGVRMDFSGGAANGKLYMTCLESDGVSKEEVKTINTNISQITGNSDNNFSAASALVNGSVDEICNSVLRYINNKDKAEQNGFYAYNYTFAKGKGYYNRVFPVIESVNNSGEDTVQSKLTVYNNSDHGIKIKAYPQYLWNDGTKDYWSSLSTNSAISETVYLAAKTKYTFTVGVKTVDGNITINDNSKKNLLNDGTLFYRVDVAESYYYNQPDLIMTNAVLEDTDVTVYNESGTKYDFSKGEHGKITYLLSTEYQDASNVQKPEVKLFNGDAEKTSEDIPPNLLRWSSLNGTLETVKLENADMYGENTVKFTAAKDKYGTALFNVAPAIYKGKVSDATYNGGGAGYYRVSFMAKAEENGKGTGSYNVRFDAEPVGSAMLSTNQPAIDMTTDWKTYSVIIEVKQERINQIFDNTKSAANTKVWLRLDGSQGDNGALKGVTSANPCTYYLDNVTIEKVEFDSKIDRSVTLQDDIKLNMFAGTDVEKVDVTFNGKTTTITEKSVEDGENKFVFEGIGPHQLGDTVTMKFYQKIENGKYVTETYQTTIKDYISNLLSANTTADEIRTLAKDLLNYGAMSQKYADYNTDVLVNDILTAEEQKAFESVEKPDSVYSQSNDYNVENPISWKSASLSLDNAVYLKFSISKDAYNEQMTAHFSVPTTIVGSSGSDYVYGSDFDGEWTEKDGKMYVEFALPATMLNRTVKVVVLEGSVISPTPVSKVLTYSVGSYANYIWDKDDENLVNLLKSIIKYGESAENLVNAKTDSEQD